MPRANTEKQPMNFKAMRQAEVPQGRNGKHKADRRQESFPISIRSQPVSR